MIINSNDEPTVPEAVEYAIKQQLALLNIGIPGSILKFDPPTGLAEVQIEVSQLYEDGHSLKVPALTNVPVERYRSNGGKSYLAIPIKKGDKGWIKFSQRMIDNWIVDGKQQYMTTLRMFDLSDAVFTPGLYPTSNPIEENNDETVLRNEGARHVLTTNSHNIKTEEGGFLRVTEDKVALGNSTAELLDLMNQLLSQLLISYGVSPVGPAPLDPVSVAKITEIQAALALIKE